MNRNVNKNMRRNSFSQRNTALFIIIAIVFFAFLNFFQNQIKNSFYLISSPIQKTFWNAGQKFYTSFETIYEIKNLKIKNQELKQENNRLLSEIASLNELVKENETLRKALDIELEKEFKLILADITSKDTSQDSILINKGLKDKILNGMVVITEEKVLLGKISEAYKDFSRVALISNKESTFSGEILATSSEEKISGIIQGREKSSLSFIRIPQDKKIFEQDIIITCALGGNFPSGLLVGKIKTVKKSDTEPFQQAEILPFFNIKKIQKIFIIRNAY